MILTPCRWGEARFGYTRWGVYNTAYQSLYDRNNNYRDFTHRVANWHVPRDTVTGWRHPTYEDITVKGILAVRNSSLSAFPAGVVMLLDAVLVLFDGVNVGDMIYDGVFEYYYSVEQIEEHRESFGEGFAYRVCHLKFRELYKEG